MELDIPTFTKIEAVGWTVTICILVFFFGHVLVFLGICFLVRKLFMWFKTKRLGLIDPSGKAVVVTGCDSGFGLGLAKRLYEVGFTVFATCLNLDSDGAKSLQNLASDRMKVINLDITNDDSVGRCQRQVKEACENTGRIVNVTSAKGLFAVPSCAAYTVAKFGGEAFSETLYQEMNQYGVTVSIIEPCNFGGTTGCLNEAGLKRIKADFDDMWREASEDVKAFYGSAHLAQQLENLRQAAATAAAKIDPVIDAFEDALRNQCPKFRYLVPGSSSFFDWSHILTCLIPYMPQSLFNKLRAYFAPYAIYK